MHRLKLLLQVVVAAIVIAHSIVQRVLMGAGMLAVLIVTVIVLVVLAAVLVAVKVAVVVVLMTVPMVALVVALVAVIVVHTTAQERVKRIVKMTAPAPVQDLVLGHVPIIAKLHVRVIAKAVAQLCVPPAMVALIAVGAMAHVQSDVTLLVMQVHMHKL